MTTYYSKTTNFGNKDSLPAGDPNKYVKGSDFDTEFNAIQAGFTSVNNDITAAILPSGMMQMFAGANAPSGWLLCQGQSLTTASYPNLFNAIGYAFGGSGSNFNLPDLRGRVPVGAGQGTNLTNRALGANGGEEAHALTSAENGPHTHTITDSGHVHPNGSPATYGTGTDNVSQGGPLENLWRGGPNNGSSATTGISINSSGSGTAHNNMQPFVVVNYIIKT